MTDQLSSKHTIVVEHVVIASSRAFETVRIRLESQVSLLDKTTLERVRSDDKEQARRGLEALPPLNIFGFRNHGELLTIAGLQRRAIQYEIGNPFTASKMTRLNISAALYAPIRVLLREDGDGVVAFEYDRPASVFGQFGDNGIDIVARQLDHDLQAALQAAAS